MEFGINGNATGTRSLIFGTIRMTLPCKMLLPRGSRFDGWYEARSSSRSNMATWWSRPTTFSANWKIEKSPWQVIRMWPLRRMITESSKNCRLGPYLEPFDLVGHIDRLFSCCPTRNLSRWSSRVTLTLSNSSNFKQKQRSKSHFKYNCGFHHSSSGSAYLKKWCVRYPDKEYLAFSIFF